jgi:hypothetical protein
MFPLGGSQIVIRYGVDAIDITRAPPLGKRKVKLAANLLEVKRLVNGPRRLQMDGILQV